MKHCTAPKGISQNLKTFLKRTGQIALSVGLSSSLIFSLTSCGSKTPSTQNAQEGMKKLSVIQFAEHPSLKNCYEGMMKGLEEQGYEVGKNLELDYQIGQADMGVTNQIVQNFVSRDSDLIVGIATPAAQAAYNAARVKGIPVLFNSVTDPILAQLQAPDGSTLEGVTGIADTLPIKQQLEMIHLLLPQAKKVGILYNIAEANSEASIKIYEKLAPDFGLEIVTQGINTAGDIPPAAEKLLSNVDCLTNLTDNLVVQNLQTILNKAKEKNIPYFGSEEEQVKNGCLAAMGLDYFQLGRQCGEMAAKILDGDKKPSELPILTIEKPSAFYNPVVAETLGIELPSSFTDNATELKP